jgi:hypothetical protein
MLVGAGSKRLKKPKKLACKLSGFCYCDDSLLLLTKITVHFAVGYKDRVRYPVRCFANGAIIDSVYLCE